MARIGIIFGLLLCGLTAIGMTATTQKSYTQFIPMMLGIPMLFLGVVSLNPHRRGGAVLVALVLSVAAVTIGGGRLVVLAVDLAEGEYVNMISLRLVLVMTVLSLIFMIVAWVWRRRRRASIARTASVEGNPNPLLENESASLKTASPEFSDNPYQSPPIVDETQKPNTFSEVQPAPASAEPSTSPLTRSDSK